jgi:hypothetical protein
MRFRWRAGSAKTVSADGVRAVGDRSCTGGIGWLLSSAVGQRRKHRRQVVDEDHRRMLSGSEIVGVRGFC